MVKSYVDVRLVARVVNEPFVRYLEYFVHREPNELSFVLIMRRRSFRDRFTFKKAHAIGKVWDRSFGFCCVLIKSRIYKKNKKLYSKIFLFRIYFEENIDILLLSSCKMRIFFIDYKHLFP